MGGYKILWKGPHTMLPDFQKKNPHETENILITKFIIYPGGST